jgi:hypothetical protein
LNIGYWIGLFQPDHIITKIYQRVELGGDGSKFTVAHAKTARLHYKTVGGYVWLYDGISEAQQIGDAIHVAQQAGIVFKETNPLWIDCETYTDGTYPKLAGIKRAVDACKANGIPCGIYTGRWFWHGHLGNPNDLSYLPLWDANYVDTDKIIAPTYGGWNMETIAGIQWTSNPIDRNIFKKRYAS